MCGILGQVGVENGLDPVAFTAMLDALKSRGPDGRQIQLFADGKAAFGHVRLAIIDLTDSGRQPMSNEDGSLWLTFNGEIYNFRELRKILEESGHIFKSHSDGEVILHAYEEWGTACLERFSGIFAFGIWDERRKLLFLARDQIGVKPLYYSASGATLQFASQLKALLAAPGYRKCVDPAAMDAYFAYGYVPYNRSIFVGINKLPPAHFLLWEDGKFRIERYWQLRYDPVIDDFELAVATVRKKLVEVVTAQLVSDVPVGIFLSGGIDSSAVTAMAKAESCQELTTFTIGFEQGKKDERRYARLVADELATRHHERALTHDAASRLLATYADVYDEPFYDNSGLATYFVANLAREHGIKVVLAGDGGDELFAGYKRYFTTSARELRRDSVLGRVARLLSFDGPQCCETPAEMYFRKVGLLDDRQRLALTGWHGDQEGTAYLAEYYCKQYPQVTAMQYVDFHTYLVEDILTKVDRASMYCGVEARVPLLDRSLVELAFQIDGRLHIRNGEKKAVLKAAICHLLPESILTARKQGFVVPMAHWMKEGLREAVARLVMDGSLVQHGLVSRRAAGKLLSDRHHHPAWQLAAAELWSRRWLDDCSVEDLALALAYRR